METTTMVLEMANWVDSLGPWKVFATHTFSWEAGLWSARRCYERFMRECLPEISHFYAIEQNPGRDGFHVHAMWDSSEAPRKATHKEWLKRYGRNRIEPIRNFADVVNYCAKYVCKESAWWDFHLSRSRYSKLGGNFSPTSPSGKILGAGLEATITDQAQAIGVTASGVDCDARVPAGAPVAERSLGFFQLES